jgi:hypothetical protein
VRDGVDALPGGDDVVGPGLDRGDLEGPAASAADEAGSGVQEAQGLGLGFRQVAVESQQLQPGQEDAGGRDHHARQLADRQVTIYLISPGRTTDLSTLTPDQFLDLADQDPGS